VVVLGGIFILASIYRIFRGAVLPVKSS